MFHEDNQTDKGFFINQDIIFPSACFPEWFKTPDTYMTQNINYSDLNSDVDDSTRIYWVSTMCRAPDNAWESNGEKGSCAVL